MSNYLKSLLNRFKRPPRFSLYIVEITGDPNLASTWNQDTTNLGELVMELYMDPANLSYRSSAGFEAKIIHFNGGVTYSNLPEVLEDVKSLRETYTNKDVTDIYLYWTKDDHLSRRPSSITPT